MFICVHALQLKNMINALFSSKDGGTKEFQRGKESVLFGWKSIMDLYKRELASQQWTGKNGTTTERSALLERLLDQTKRIAS